nr:TPA: hypothetical protein GDO54_005419 [Pyxicephalus adspersus]
MSAGLDFRSDKLWEMYISYETEQKNISGVTSIYSRLLSIPTQLYAQHFQRFKDHIQGNLPRDFLTSEKFVELRKELAEMSKQCGVRIDYPTGLEEITDPAKRTTEVENMRHRIIEVHQEIFSLNENEVHKRWTFEEGYAKYIERHSAEGARHVYTRACTIHLQRKPLAHLLWAAFEEQQGNIDDAKNILKSLEDRTENLAMVRLRRVNLERRSGNLNEAENLLAEAMKNAKSNNEFSFYAIKLSRHYSKIQKNIVKAKKVLTDAIQRDKENTKLYLNLINLEFSGDVKQNEANILSHFDKVIKSSMPIAARVTFSQRKVEFLEDFGSDINKLLTAYDDHQKLLKEQDNLKRKSENGLEQPDAKRLHTEDPSVLAAAPVAAAATGAVPSAYDYSNWYQYNYQNAGAWNYGQYYHPPST